MKKQLTLNIPKSCSEKWDGFMPTSAGGRLCHSCNKVVTDFTRMSDQQILEFFSNTADNTCGRFRPDQLKVYSHPQPVNIRPGFALLKAGLLSLLMVFISKPSSANTTTEKPKLEIAHYPDHRVDRTTSDESDYIVRGFVKSQEDDSALPGVNVYLKGSTQGTVTDAEGHFEFPVKLRAGDVLVFSFIGLVTQEYEVPNEVKDVVEMRMALYYDITGEVAVNDVYAQHPSFLQGLWQKLKGLF